MEGAESRRGGSGDGGGLALLDPGALAAEPINDAIRWTAIRFLQTFEGGRCRIVVCTNFGAGHHYYYYFSGAGRLAVEQVASA
jgi:hypothetical protein